MSDSKDRSNQPPDDRKSDGGDKAFHNSEEDCAPRWDADDVRRRKDCFAPPMTPCECYCLHCRRTFSSDGIWFQRVVGAPAGELDGFWLCPTSNCDGKGFTFDIFPTDPSHPANEGWVYSDDEDDEFDEFDEDDDEDEMEFDDEADFVNPLTGQRGDEAEPIDPELQAAIEHDLEILREGWAETAKGDSDNRKDDPEWLRSPPDQWNPEADAADAAEIIEGDEWKLGYSPVDTPPDGFYQSEESRRHWEEEEALYNAPDERPREIPWIDRRSGGETLGEDEIPF